MNLETFFEKFDLFAECPNAVQKMRELILELAVQGKLVEQRDDEGSGRDLLISRNAKEVLTSDLGRIPGNWCWTTFGQICDYIQRGKGPKYAENGKVRVISQKCVQWSGFDLSVARYVDDSSLSAYGEERFLKAGDLLWNSTGTGTAGRAIVVPHICEKLVADSHVTVVRSEAVDSRYLWCLIVSPSIQGRFDPKHESSLVSGSTNQVELATGVVKAMPFPLPPLAEQKRIVAKVDELMAMCDALEAQQKERETKRTALAKASLAAFAEAPSPQSLELLFHPSYAIDPADLRKSILTLAVQGKLVEQDEAVEPLEESLANLGLNLQSVDADFVIPESWRVSAFEDVCVITGGVTLGRKLGGRKTIALPYLRVANVKGGSLDLSVIKEVVIAEDEIERYALKDRDILMTEGGDWDKVGRAAIWRGEIPLCLHQNHIFRCRLRSPMLSPLWFELFFNSPDGRRYFEAAAKQTTNLASINMRQVRACPVPLPPLAEQKRIVAKVDELMALVDRLEAKEKAARETASRLLEAMVAELSGRAAA